MQHARRYVQKHCRSRVSAWLDDLPGAAQPELCLVEFAHPHCHAANRPEGGGDYRLIVEAMTFGQGDGLLPALACLCDRNEL